MIKKTFEYIQAPTKGSYLQPAAALEPQPDSNLHTGKSIMDLTPKSVMKKFKQKSFAAGVNCSIIEEGAALLEMDLSEIIEETFKGMQAVAEDLGLKGEFKKTLFKCAMILLVCIATFS